MKENMISICSKVTVALFLSIHVDERRENGRGKGYLTVEQIQRHESNSIKR